MYRVLRFFLFFLPPEIAHDISLIMMKFLSRLGLLKFFAYRVPKHTVELMGLTFPNPVGLAAGLDKNADYYRALANFGFGFIEVGTVTPLAQMGNAKPRMFRLESEQAVINRMGFNNKGVQHLVEQVRSRSFDGIIGINIGKNKSTPEAEALNDYALCMDAVFPYADYIAINISSPNTPGLRDLQHGHALKHLLEGIKTRQAKLANQHQRQVPIAVKIAPDVSELQLKDMAKVFLEVGVDAVIATNTTVAKEAVAHLAEGGEQGGLSGAPLTDRSTEVIRQLHTHLNGKIPIIGVGGIMSGQSAAEKIRAGASLVQLYSGFVYRGPVLVKEAAEACASALESPALEEQRA